MYWLKCSLDLVCPPSKTYHENLGKERGIDSLKKNHLNAVMHTGPVLLLLLPWRLLAESAIVSAFQLCMLKGKACASYRRVILMPWVCCTR